jgi:hypothetical protein
MSKNTIPPKGSSQWKKNEKMIASNPVLRAARDTAEGFKASSGISSFDNSPEYKENFDKIDWGTKDETPKKYRVKVNGKYIDEQDD